MLSPQILRPLQQLKIENKIILMTDGRTDGQTDRSVVTITAVCIASNASNAVAFAILSFDPFCTAMGVGLGCLQQIIFHQQRIFCVCS